jgi:hypothetical protein
MQISTLTHAPWTVLGYRKDGRPILPIAGASEPAPEIPLPGPPGSTVTIPAPPPAPPAPNGNAAPVQTFTHEDIERARKQEKDKMYERLNKAEELIKNLTKDRDERFAAEEKARQEAEAAAEAERQKNLTFEQRLAELSTDWESKFVDMSSQIAQRDALLERERQFQTLQQYRQRRLDEESETIIPDLHGWVMGNSEDEIEASISRAKETTASILGQITQAQQQQAAAQQQMRQQAKGVGVTAPPVGPMENQSDQQTFSASDIANMNMSDYMKHRDRLLEAASQQFRGRGI